MTFSIAARDGDAWGVAVASRFLAVGSIVPAVRPGVGAVATQSLARVAYLDEVLDALAEGPRSVRRWTRRSPPTRTGPSPGRRGRAHRCRDLHRRRVPRVRRGVAAGDERTAYAIQGNILTGPEVLEAMERPGWPPTARAWTSACSPRCSPATRPVATHGDGRAPRSSPSPGAGYDRCGVLADLRVDDHPDAPRELARLHDLAVLYSASPRTSAARGRPA